jgi:hypothetical protein
VIKICAARCAAERSLDRLNTRKHGVSRVTDALNKAEHSARLSIGLTDLTDVVRKDVEDTKAL